MKLSIEGKSHMRIRRDMCVLLLCVSVNVGTRIGPALTKERHGPIYSKDVK